MPAAALRHAWLPSAPLTLAALATRHNARLRLGVDILKHRSSSAGKFSCKSTEGLEKKRKKGKFHGNPPRDDNRLLGEEVVLHFVASTALNSTAMSHVLCIYCNVFTITWSSSPNLAYAPCLRPVTSCQDSCHDSRIDIGVVVAPRDLISI